MSKKQINIESLRNVAIYVFWSLQDMYVCFSIVSVVLAFRSDSK